MDEVKSTPEWIEFVPYKVEILDPDGWDRTRLEESFAEKITYKEFLRRVAFSTVMLGAELSEAIFAEFKEEEE